MAMDNSLAEVHPELVSEWSEKNLPLTPDEITFGSNKKVYRKRKGGNEPMRNVNLEENELTITAIFQQHTKEETIQTLKEALEVLEQEKGDPENEEIF